MFSKRLPDHLAPNALSAAVARARAAGRPLLDLTVSNPTEVGLAYPPGLLAPLGEPAGLTYRPEPFGLPGARDAVARELATSQGLEIDRTRVTLTASTSEAYATLFRLLCDPGDEVLVPRPSYPLFEHLTALDAVRAVPYDLAYDGVWTIDRGSVERALGPRTRALLVVSPNNPTGSMLKAPERAWLDEACAARGVALVADEVFADYPIAPDPEAVRGVLARGVERGGAPGALTFSLGGLSKSVGLPQLKVAWIATGGPPALVDAALARLEVICDTYLSVATPAQLALGRLLDHGRVVRDAIRARLASNLEQLSRGLERCPACSVLRVEGGWSAVVRVPATQPEERLVLDLLDEDGVLAHPGYFFDFRHEAFLVVSLLTPTDVLQEGVARIARRMAG